MIGKIIIYYLCLLCTLGIGQVFIVGILQIAILDSLHILNVHFNRQGQTGPVPGSLWASGMSLFYKASIIK